MRPGDQRSVTVRAPLICRRRRDETWCVADEQPTVAPRPETPVSSEGVDLTQIRALRRLTPTERVRVLVATVRNLQQAKQNVRRL